MRIALICNTSSAFPLLNWLESQGVLVGIAFKDQKSDFSADLSMICNQKRIIPQILKKDTLSTQLSDWIIGIRADIVLVLAFPYKIPKEILVLPPLGIYNIHFGKLPKYGGSFPVFWQIKNREKEAILTIHKMDENYDSGPIAIEISFDILPANTYGIVETNYSYMAINAVFQLLDGLMKNTLKLKAQNQSVKCFFPKPSLKDLIISWKSMDAEEITALIKAGNPWNRGAIARVNGVDIKIVEAKWKTAESKTAGEIITVTANGMEVSCIKNTSLEIKIIYSQFGYFDSENMGAFGIKKGDVFETILL